MLSSLYRFSSFSKLSKKLNSLRMIDTIFPYVFSFISSITQTLSVPVIILPVLRSPLICVIVLFPVA